MSNKKNQNYSDLKRQLEHAAAPPTPERYTAETVEPADPRQPAVTDRQERIPGFDQALLADTTVLLVGAGGLGGLIGLGLTWKGVGTIEILDEDVVEVANLSRQPYHEEDVGENKAISLARALVREGTRGTDLVGYPHHFEDALALGYTFDPDIVLCCPDNDMARRAVTARFYGEVPVIVTGLDEDANGGYVFVQDPDGPCFACFRPNAGGAGACPGAPAVLDPGYVIGGLALHAVDATVMGRYQAWNVVELWLSGDLPAVIDTVEQRADCSLCGGG